MDCTKLSSAVDNNTQMNGTVWISVIKYRDNLFFPPAFLVSGYNADIFLDVKTKIEREIFVCFFVFCVLAGVIEVNS